MSNPPPQKMGHLVIYLDRNFDPTGVAYCTNPSSLVEIRERLKKGVPH